MRRIADLNDINDGLDALEIIDPRLTVVRAAAGEVPLRINPPGFASLVRIITGQQVSTASAAAIYTRTEALIEPLTSETVLVADDSLFREAGQSRAKVQAIRAIAQAAHEGRLDLLHLIDLDADHAIAQLTSVKGIGPWTAQLYLLFCAGHPDIFPAKDVALQAAVGHAFGHESRPDDRKLQVIAEAWTPWRGVAARLFWAYYRYMKGREGILSA